MLNTMMVESHSLSPWVVILAAAACAGDGNLYPKYVSVPVKKDYPFHDERGPIIKPRSPGLQTDCPRDFISGV